MDYYESVSDGIRVDRFNENSVVILLRISYSSKLGLSKNKMLGVADISKIGEVISCK